MTDGSQTWLDGLGRPVQEVRLGTLSEERSIVVTEYDSCKALVRGTKAICIGRPYL